MRQSLERYIRRIEVSDPVGVTISRAAKALPPRNGGRIAGPSGTQQRAAFLRGKQNGEKDRRYGRPYTIGAGVETNYRDGYRKGYDEAQFKI